MRKNRRSPPPPAKSKGNIQIQNRPSFGSMILDGITFGAGSSLGHRAVDVALGPRRVEISQPQVETSTNNQFCQSMKDQFEKCIKNNISDCSDLNDILIKYNCQLN